MMDCRRASLLLLLSPLLALTGCNLLAYPLAITPGAPVAAAYHGLAGQTVGVLVWADPATRIDFPSLNGDIASAVQSKLKDQPKSEDLKGAQYLRPSDVADWQKAHPELDSAPIEDVAPRLGVKRVIYIEVQSFQTRSPDSVDLFRGSIEASLFVLEVDGSSVKTAYRETGIRINYPKKGSEGVPAGLNADTHTMYSKTIDLFGDEIAKRFYKHEDDDDDTDLP